MSNSSAAAKRNLELVTETANANADEGAQASRGNKITMKYLTRALIKYNASDLHLKAGRPPLYRINGKLIPAKMPPMEADQLLEIVHSVMTPKQKAELEDRKQMDLSFQVPDLGRFRANVFFQRGAVSAAIRMIPLVVPTLDELQVPAVLKELCMRPRGLLLVTGATGSGKSTTLAAMIQHINERSQVHVLSIEDPIEFIHRDIKATVTQRELGIDTNSLIDAIYAGLRQDIDVISIGELRDREMIQIALSAAETGHLVIATLHTSDAKSTIDRIIDVFPAEAKNQARIQLSSALVGVVTQQLLVRADGAGRVPACEVLVKSPIIESYILRNELEKIPEAIANSNTYYKMQSMNQSLEQLVRSGMVTADEALKCSGNLEELKLRLSGVSREEGYQMVGQYQEKFPKSG